MIRSFFGVAIDKITALQIGFMRLDGLRSAFFRCVDFGLNLRFGCRIRRAGELLQLFDDSLSKLGLDREDVLQIARMIFRTGLFAGLA